MRCRILSNLKLGDIDVLILCGGKGTRLRKIVSDRPKPMAQMDHRPFLDIVISHLSGFGLRRFILCTGYKSEAISQYYARKSRDLEVLISNEQKPLGTAGAIGNAEKLIRSHTFLVVNGDSFCNLNLTAMLGFHSKNKALASIAVIKSDGRDDTGQIKLDISRRITAFCEKKQTSIASFVNAGIYIFEREVLSYIDPGRKCSLEYDVFPKLAGDKFYGYVSEGKLIDIGTPDRLALAREYFSSDQSGWQQLSLTENTA